MEKFLIFLTIFTAFFINAEAFAKRHKVAKPAIIETAVSDQYLLSFDLSQKECEQLIGGECFRRDHSRDTPYYHQSRIVIFNKKIFAQQFFENREKTTNALFLQVKDGSYKLKTVMGNIASFSAKNGVVSDLKLINGDLSLEEITISSCDIAPTDYGFYQAYDKSQISEKSTYFKDEYNFEGLKELVVFITKADPDKMRVLLKNSARNVEAIENLSLCKMFGDENLFVKHISNAECEKTLDLAAQEECSRNSRCEDFLLIEDCNVRYLK